MHIVIDDYRKILHNRRNSRARTSDKNRRTRYRRRFGEPPVAGGPAADGVGLKKTTTTTLAEDAIAVPAAAEAVAEEAEVAAREASAVGAGDGDSGAAAAAAAVGGDDGGDPSKTGPSW